MTTELETDAAPVPAAAVKPSIKLPTIFRALGEAGLKVLASEHLYWPESLHEGKWAQTVDVFVVPKNPDVFDPTSAENTALELQLLMECLLPLLPEPDEGGRVDFDSWHGHSMRLGCLTFTEVWGPQTLKLQRTTEIFDDNVNVPDGYGVGEPTVNLEAVEDGSSKLLRRTRVWFCPSEDWAERAKAGKIVLGWTHHFPKPDPISGPAAGREDES